MLSVDFRSVRGAIRDAARRAFTLVRSKHSDERFYTFALCSDLDAQSVCASANTEEGYQRCLKRYEKHRKATEAAIAKHGMTYADYSNYFRWNLPEWAYHQAEIREFRALDPLILDPLHSLADELESEDPDGFDLHRADLYQSMILALKDLDGEGFFGAEDQRRAVVLLCDLVDPPEKYWFAVESARILNPPEVFGDFLSQWLAWLSPADKEVIENPAPHSPVYQPFRELIAETGGGPSARP